MNIYSYCLARCTTCLARDFRPCCCVLLLHQARVAAKRAAASGVTIGTQNTYAPGDFVLFQLDPTKPRPTKLSPKYLGPYQVINQDKNDVSARHVNLGDVRTMHVERLKPFYGSLADAQEMAMLDQDQYLITSILAYRGDPDQRTSTQFEVEFADGSILWLPWSQDLSRAVQFEDFCRSRSELEPLIYDLAVAKMLDHQLTQTPIVEVAVGDSVWIDLRFYGSAWYTALNLPDLDHTRYVVSFTYTRWAGHTRRWIDAVCPLFNEQWPKRNHVFVKRWGSKKTLQDFNGPTVAVTAEFCALYPQVLPA
eukprot:gene27063-32700_t